jgi:HAD superfamily hydrolase (TIGR01509 family)
LIRALIFDLDGTLVDTELLKARAYALVAQSLLGLAGPDERAIEVYCRLVGNTDETVANAMIRELGLEPALRSVAGDARREKLWEALHRLRIETYQERTATAEAIRAGGFRHNIAVLLEQRAAGRLIAVATSSYRDEAMRVLAALGVSAELDLVVGRDGVDRPKPDPEVYLKTMAALRVGLDETVVIEDSPVGLTAAIASGARWVCVANAFSAAALKQMAGVDHRWIVLDPSDVGRVVRERIAQSVLK